MSGRVQAVARQLSKVGQKDPKRKACLDEALAMVKRKDPVVTTGSASTTAKTIKRKDDSWRYPGKVVVRATHLSSVKNAKGGSYTDPKSEGEGRKKIESNFFITMNTNRQLTGGPQLAAGKDCVDKVLKDLAKDAHMCQYMKFGPVHAEFRDDLYEHVVQSTEWTAAVEVGEIKHRLHCHIWLTVHHFSQIQVNMPMMQYQFKRLYNGYVDSLYPQFAKELKQRGNPYIQVKLLPTSDWALVMRQYIHKAMVT